MKPSATVRQLFVLAKLAELLAAGQSPSFRQLAEACGCRSVRTITEHLHYLRRMGLVTSEFRPREPWQAPMAAAGTLRITEAGAQALAAFNRTNDHDATVSHDRGR